MSDQRRPTHNDFLSDSSISTPNQSQNRRTPATGKGGNMAQSRVANSAARRQTPLQPTQGKENVTPANGTRLTDSQTKQVSESQREGQTQQTQMSAIHQGQATPSDASTTKVDKNNLSRYAKKMAGCCLLWIPTSGTDLSQVTVPDGYTEDDHYFVMPHDSSDDTEDANDRWAVATIFAINQYFPSGLIVKARTFYSTVARECSNYRAYITQTVKAHRTSIFKPLVEAGLMTSEEVEGLIHRKNRKGGDNLKRLLGFDATNPDNGYDSMPPLLLSLDPSLKKAQAMFRGPVVRNMLAVNLIGPSAASGAGPYSIPKGSYADKWGVKEVSIGHIAAAAVVVRWVLSDDETFGPVGTTSGINYLASYCEYEHHLHKFRSKRIVKDLYSDLNASIFKSTSARVLAPQAIPQPSRPSTLDDIARELEEDEDEDDGGRALNEPLGDLEYETGGTLVDDGEFEEYGGEEDDLDVGAGAADDDLEVDTGAGEDDIEEDTREGSNVDEEQAPDSNQVDGGDMVADDEYQDALEEDDQQDVNPFVSTGPEDETSLDRLVTLADVSTAASTQARPQRNQNKKSYAESENEDDPSPSKYRKTDKGARVATSSGTGKNKAEAPINLGKDRGAARGKRGGGQARGTGATTRGRGKAVVNEESGRAKSGGRGMGVSRGVGAGAGRGVGRGRGSA